MTENQSTLPALPDQPMWSDWDAEAHGFDCNVGCGLTIDGVGHPVTGNWLCWDDVIALYWWLGQKIEEANHAR